MEVSQVFYLFGGFFVSLLWFVWLGFLFLFQMLCLTEFIHIRWLWKEMLFLPSIKLPPEFKNAVWHSSLDQSIVWSERDLPLRTDLLWTVFHLKQCSYSLPSPGCLSLIVPSDVTHEEGHFKSGALVTLDARTLNTRTLNTRTTALAPGKGELICVCICPDACLA